MKSRGCKCFGVLRYGISWSSSPKVFTMSRPMNSRARIRHFNRGVTRQPVEAKMYELC